MAFERLLDDLHLDLAQRLRRDVLKCGPCSRRWPKRIGKCSAETGPSSHKMAACSITLASSRTLPGQRATSSARSASGVNAFVPGSQVRPEARQQVPRPARNVVGPLAQGRQVNLERVDAEHQVFAELAFGDHLLQVAVRGADHAHVDDERLVVAHAADFAAFQHPQQLGLHRLGQLADLVEKQRAAVGHLEQPDAMLVGAGERSLAMAEQLAFDQALGQGAAVDRHERHVAPQALIVNGPGDQLLAGAGFAEHQHGGIGRRDLGDQLADLRPSAATRRSVASPPSSRSSCRLSARYLLRQLAFLRPRGRAALPARPACRAWSDSRRRPGAGRRSAVSSDDLPVSTTASVSGESSLAWR